MKKQTWNIVQFSADGERYRLVSRAFVDGCSVGDRFLEGCMFEVRVSDGELVVRADEDTETYLAGRHVSVKAWEKRVLSYVKKCGDNLTLDGVESDSNGWETFELHLTDNHSEVYAKEQGLKLEAGI